MTSIQLIAAGVGAVMLWLSYSAFRRRDLGGRELVVWIAIWGGLILVSLLGDRVRGLIVPLQVARLLDLVMVAAILILAILVLHLNSQVRRYERRLAELVRQLALDEAASPPPSA